MSRRFFQKIDKTPLAAVNSFFFWKKPTVICHFSSVFAILDFQRVFFVFLVINFYFFEKSDAATRKNANFIRTNNKMRLLQFEKLLITIDKNWKRSPFMSPLWMVMSVFTETYSLTRVMINFEKYKQKTPCIYSENLCR